MTNVAQRDVWIAWLALATVVIVAAGCDSGPRQRGATVQGTVVVGGELLPSGTVTFHPVGDGPVAYGVINADGSFSLRTGQGDMSDPDGGTISVGKYIATVVAMGPSTGESIKATGESIKGSGGPPVSGPLLTAFKYADKETSNLKFTVNRGLNTVVLELERPEPEDSEESDDRQEPGSELSGSEAGEISSEGNEPASVEDEGESIEADQEESDQ